MQNLPHCNRLMSKHSASCKNPVGKPVHPDLSKNPVYKYKPIRFHYACKLMQDNMAERYKAHGSGPCP